MIELQLKKEFFARVMHAPKNEVSCALLIVIEQGLTMYRPVLTVRNLKENVYDILTAEFISAISVPEITKRLEPAKMQKTRRGVVFKSEISDAKANYTTRDFYNTYKWMVLNKYLK